MSTRCHVEICDGSAGDGVLLYHHSDGYPSFQRPKLHRYLEGAFARLTAAGYPYWWDSERVAALLVMLSAGNYEKPAEPEANGVPVYQPAHSVHGDIEWFYSVLLDPAAQGKYTIEVRKDKGGPLIETVKMGQPASAEA